MTSQNLTSLQHQFSGWEQAQEYYVEANLTGSSTSERLRGLYSSPVSSPVRRTASSSTREFETK